MAHSANRSIDFAPAWLKLPEQSQEQKRKDLQNFSRHNQPFKGGSHHNQSQIYLHNNIPHQIATQQAQHQQAPFNQSAPHHQASNRQGRAPLNSFNGRSVAHHPSQQLQRSQSTGSYTVNGHRPASNTTPNNTAATPTSSDVLEEDFPLLSTGAGSSVTNNQVNSSIAQWRKKASAADQQNIEKSNGKPGQGNDRLLTSSLSSGKVYRAQVRTVKRSNMIPIVNGKNSNRPGENGDHSFCSTLSSSVEKEKRLLQEMGWKEDDESEEECVIPEQDPEQLQEIFMKAKAARERLLMKSKQSLKVAPTVAAVLPNEDELPSSSDNSDVE